MVRPGAFAAAQGNNISWIQEDQQEAISQPTRELIAVMLIERRLAHHLACLQKMPMHGGVGSAAARMEAVRQHIEQALVPQFRRNDCS